MYESKCYNFDWLVNWLGTNFTENLNSEFQLSANLISGNFSYAYFKVTPEDIIEAFKILGFKAIILNEKHFYKLDITSPGIKKFETALR